MDNPDLHLYAVLARTRGQLDELRTLVDRLEAELAANTKSL